VTNPLKMRWSKRNSILTLQPHLNHVSLYTEDEFAKRCTRIGAVLNKKQSFRHFLDSCCDYFTENEVEQEELNTDPTTQYDTFVSIHSGRNHKNLRSLWSCLERETVV
jgi:hypothetical protein